MGATNTLADYLISIRAKTKGKRRRDLSSFIKQTSGRDWVQRSLAKEIWNAPNKSSNNKRRSYSIIDTTRTKRMRTLSGSSRSSKYGSIVSAETVSHEGGFQLSNPSAGCTLQPHFTKEEDHNHHQHHLVQYRFEFSRDLLEKISLNDIQSSAVVESSDSSVISQITQDSSLNEDDDDDDEGENDCYSYISESDGNVNDYISSDDEASSQSTVGTSTYYYRNNESSRKAPEVKTAELKEGAQLLLDLFSMQ